MNKFIIALAIVACAGLASASALNEEQPSQMALFETDDKEVAGLGAEMAVFKDFCLETRDLVKSYLKTSMGEGSTKLFTGLADTMAAISNAIGEAYHQAVQQNGAGIAEGNIGFGQAAFILTQAVTGSTKGKIMDELTNLKYLLTTENLQQAADSACEIISVNLKNAVDKKFNNYKRDLQKVEYSKVVGEAKLKNLGCVTTSRLSRVATICRFMRTMAPAALEMLGY